MIERAHWREGTGGPQSPVGLLYGRDRWLGVPVGGWIALYAAIVFFGLSFVLPGYRSFVFVVAFWAFRPLWTSRRSEAEPIEGGLKERIKRALKNPQTLFWVKSTGDVHELLPSPGPAEGFDVELTLRRGARTTGSDSGVIVFSEGWLVYEGHETAFVLSPSDVQGSKLQGTTWSLLLPKAQNLRLASPRSGWKEAMKSWLASSPPTGLSRLPPLEPSLAIRLRTAGNLHSAAYVVCGIVVGALIRAPFFHQGLLPAASLLRVAAIAGFLFLAGWWMAWHRR